MQRGGYTRVVMAYNFARGWGITLAILRVIAKSGLVAYGLMALDLGDHKNAME